MSRWASVADRLLHYARQWRSLPDEERRVRAGRVVDRLLRRNPSVRRLSLVADPPRWASFRRALDVPAAVAVRGFREIDPRRGPLAVDLEPRARRVAERCPQHVEEVLRHAVDLLDHRFDLLGSGPTRPQLDDGRIDWHLDWKSGRHWDPRCFHLDVPVVRGDGSDVKVPWELSRFQHLTVLAQAYRLAPHALSAQEATGLRRKCALETRAQIEDWITQNPRGLGVNWTCTMDVAIRAFNWIATLAMLRDSELLDDAFFLQVLRSLWSHGRHIRRHLEIGADDLTSNHYLSNIVGLYAIACSVPELRESSPWRAMSHAALIEEMDRQVLTDGVDFERSIPYHRLVTELFVHGALLARAAGDAMPPEFHSKLGLMLEFTATTTRPDGSVPQWGDNDDGRLLPLCGYATHSPHDHRHLLALGGSLLSRPDLVASAGDRTSEALWLLDPDADDAGDAAGEWPSRAFPAAGYFVMRRNDLHAGISCGPVGTRGLGNHTHNDLFALCVWAGGREWCTDPGTGCYTSDPELRNRLRSTSAHGTLQLGTREQNPFGPALDDLFVVTPRARPEVLEWRSDRDGDFLAARHLGFSDENLGWAHVREIRFDPCERVWRIDDRLECDAGDTNGSSEIDPAERVHLRFPLAPDVVARTVVDGDWPAAVHAAIEQGHSPRDRSRVRSAVELGDERARRFWIAFDLPGGSSVEIEPGVHSARYGVTEIARVVVAVLPASSAVRARTILHSPAADASAGAP